MFLIKKFKFDINFVVNFDVMMMMLCYNDDDVMSCHENNAFLKIKMLKIVNVEFMKINVKIFIFFFNFHHFQNDNFR